MTFSQGLLRFVGGQRILFVILSVALSAVMLPGQARAVDGVWNPSGFAGDGTGLWSDTTKWTGGTVANGAGSLANFSTLNITADSTVSLDSSRTIGRLQFGDVTTNSSNWILNDNGNPLNVLTLDNTGGSGGPRITLNNQTTTISTVLAGTTGVTLVGGGTPTNTSASLVLPIANSYSGGTTINSTAGSGAFSVFVGNSTSLGAGDIHFNPGTANNARIVLGNGVTINNNIYLDTIRGIAGGNGAIMAGSFNGGNGTTNNDAAATVNGTIFVNSPSLSGGTFNGSMTTNNSAATGNAISANYLTFNGPVIFNSTTSSPKGTNGAGGNIIIHRGGNIRYANATATPSSWYRIELRAGIAQVGANNGMATNGYLDLGGNSNNNPNAYAIVDLNGFNQTLIGLSNYISQGNPSTVTNTSTTTASTFTIAPPDPSSNANQANLWWTGGGGGTGNNANITNVSPAAPLNVTINGHASGTQYITTTGNTYTGVTTLTSGTMAVSALADGGVSTTIVTTAGVNTATVGTTTGLAVGQFIVAPGVRTNTFNGIAGVTITAIDTGTNTITMSENAGAGDGVTANPVAFGAGNGLGISTNAESNLVFDGGKLSYVRGVPGVATTNNTPVNFTAASATPSTNRNFTINSGKTGTIDVQNGAAAPIQTVLTMSGASKNTTGSLIKTGPGTLVLSGANQHTGGTTVSTGTLLVSGSLSTGAVSVASGATLGGTGTIGGTVTPAAGGIIAPGASVGTLTVNSMVLNTGSFVDFEFSGSDNDKLTVSSAGGLQLNGGNIHLYNEGAVTDFATNGTYTLFIINGGFGGALTNLTVANPVAGKFYSLGNSPTSEIRLTIGTATTVNWNGNTSSSWTLGANWVGGVSPNAVGTSVRFNGGNLSGAASSTVSVDGGGKTASGVIFNDDSSSTSFNITGPGTLTLNNGVAAAAINVNSGAQTISAPVLVTNALSIGLSNTSSLLVSGAISGGRPLSMNGTGTVTLTGNNAYSTTTLTAAAADSAILNVGTFGGADTTGSLGTGDLTMSGGAVLNFNRSNAYNFAGGVVGTGATAGTVNQLGTGPTSITGGVSNVTSVNVSAGSLTVGGVMSQSAGINVTGSGSLTANGAVNGAGGLTVNSTGTVSLNATNGFTGGVSLDGGTVVVNAAGALAPNSVLAISGGTLDLHGNNISLSSLAGTVAGGTTPGGVITNLGPNNSTSTMTFVGANSQDYNLYAAVNDNTNGRKVAVSSGILNSVSAGTPARILFFHSTGTYTGGTTVTLQSIQANANDAFGTGPISIPANNTSTNWSQIFVNTGVTIHNDITIGQGKPTSGAGGTVGVIQQAGDGSSDSHVFGSVTIQANNFDGGLFQGPAVGGAGFLHIHGPVNTAGTANTVIQSGGQVKYYGGGNAQNFVANGLAQLGAHQGLSQSAVVQVAVDGAGTVDLAGFNQTLRGLTTVNANAAAVINTGTGPNTLTLNTLGSNTFAGTIDGSINLSVGGSGTQILTGANAYTGDTKVLGGTLSITDVDLFDSADVYVANGGKLILDTMGSIDLIGSLFLDGVPRSGVWGGPLSGAANISLLLDGSGRLNVQTPGPNLAGDYDGNGIVDARDYVKWRDNVGTTNVLSNDPTGGTIGQTQYDTWRANFGRTFPGSSAGETTSLVPEPGTFGLILLAMCGASIVFRRRVL